MRPDALTPYCGVPPTPIELWARWNLDPFLIAGLALVALIYAAASPPAGKKMRAPAFFGGWAILSLALVSPLCALSVSLFSARIAQHMIIGLIAAPLIAWGEPLERIGTLWGKSGQAAPARLWTATVLFAFALWFWHTPAPYDATFGRHWIYWAMHITIFGAAFMLWRGLFMNDASAAAGVGAAVISSAQMGFLGAVITLAPTPLYVAHFKTTASWGLTPLQDQQLGGAIMWAPGCVVFLAAAAFALARLLREAPPRSAAEALR